MNKLIAHPSSTKFLKDTIKEQIELITELRKAIAEKNVIIDGLKVENEDYKAVNSELSNEIVLLKDELCNAHEFCDNMAREIKQLKIQLQSAESRMQGFRDGIEDAKKAGLIQEPTDD